MYCITELFSDKMFQLAPYVNEDISTPELYILFLVKLVTYNVELCKIIEYKTIKKGKVAFDKITIEDELRKLLVDEYDMYVEEIKKWHKQSGLELKKFMEKESNVPDNIYDAWKWKQYSEIISDITKEPFGALQEESVKLSKKYRKATAEVVEWEAWYHLSKRTEGDISMRQALNGWKQTIKKIGKGTGKYAAKNKAKPGVYSLTYENTDSKSGSGLDYASWKSYRKL